MASKNNENGKKQPTLPKGSSIIRQCRVTSAPGFITIRSFPIGKMNCPFADSKQVDQRAAAIQTLPGTAKLNSVG
jgi:hypothetical protein